MGNYLHTLKLESLYTLYTVLFYKVVVGWNFITLFVNEFNKIAPGSSYKMLNLWKFTILFSQKSFKIFVKFIAIFSCKYKNYFKLNYFSGTLNLVFFVNKGLVYRYF